MNLKTLRLGAGIAILGIAGFVAWILAAIIHVWTVVIAFMSGGLVSAVITLLLPVLSQIYWGFVIFSATGTIFNTYCLALVAYVVLWGILLLGSLLFNE
jgi:hypothetical protein